MSHVNISLSLPPFKSAKVIHAAIADVNDINDRKTGALQGRNIIFAVGSEILSRYAKPTDKDFDCYRPGEMCIIVGETVDDSFTRTDTFQGESKQKTAKKSKLSNVFAIMYNEAGTWSDALPGNTYAGEFKTDAPPKRRSMLETLSGKAA